MSRHGGNRVKAHIRTLVVAGALGLVPLTISGAAGVESNSAQCATAEEGCCRNPDGICQLSGTPGGAYYGYEARTFWQKIFGC